ncbi:MAG: M24 family metallopeptidase, partial [Propionibacteriaceae bacterium]
KLAAMASVARSAGCDRLVLRRQSNLSYLVGGRSNVPQTLDSACFDLVIETEPVPKATVVTNAIEAPRLAATELAGAPTDWDVVDWWTDRSQRLPSGPGVASDGGVPDTTDLSAQVATVRRSLTPHQQGQLRELCRDAAAAATRSATRLTPYLIEYEAAGIFARELLAGAMDPIVLLVAGQERMPRDRHPLPSTAVLGDRAMLVCCARRHGLVASVTRIISFSPLTATDWDRYDALLRVEAAFLDATLPGVSLGEVVSSAVTAYGREGFDALEWHHHHQGGFTGWEPREFPARPTSGELIQINGMLGWNPSAAGWKVEDTCLVTAQGAEPLVQDHSWPTRVVSGRERPAVLEA